MKPLSRTRSFPDTCLFIAIARALTGRLRFPGQLLGKRFGIDGDHVFRVFRHMKFVTGCQRRGTDTAVFAVRFRFARFSQAVNRALSLIPIPLIGGFPGFHEKIWMVDEDSGEWLGLYEWKSELHAEAYEKSFVLRLMTRRAANGSVSIQMVPGISVTEYLHNRLLRG